MLANGNINIKISNIVNINCMLNGKHTDFGTLDPLPN